MFSPTLASDMISPNIIAEHVFSKIVEHFSPHLRDVSPIREQLTFFSVLFGEDPVFDLSLHVLWARALRYGWSTTISWSRLFVLHVYELRARRYGLWVSQGREFSIAYIVQTPLMLPLSPSSYNNRQAAHVPRCFLWRRPSHRSLPTRVMGSTLCVMGGRLWFLGHACYSYMCTGSALDVMDYGLAKAIGISNRPTIWTLFELRIIALGLKLSRFFRQSTSKLHILHTQAPCNIFSINNCFLCFRVF
jgi:hypothetical protein